MLIFLLACEWRLAPPVQLPLLGPCTDTSEPVPLYKDEDGDGIGVLDTVRQGCLPMRGWVEDEGDCDDSDPLVYPDAPERCNDIDDNCDFVVDEAPAVLWCADLDNDGYGDPGDGVHVCDRPHSYIGDCSDCNDTDPAISPAMYEIAGDGVDNDCDGAIDEAG